MPTVLERPQVRRCLRDVDPDDKFEPLVGGSDLWRAHDLDEIETLMRDNFPEFQSLPSHVVWLALYKPKAGKSGGQSLIAKTQLTSGPLALFSKASVIATFAYNEMFQLTNWQAEAAVYHELKKLEWKIEPKTGEGQLVIRRPDFSGFVDEVARYGKWRKGLKRAQDALDQAPLFPIDGTDDVL